MAFVTFLDLELLQETSQCSGSSNMVRVGDVGSNMFKCQKPNLLDMMDLFVALFLNMDSYKLVPSTISLH